MVLESFISHLHLVRMMPMSEETTTFPFVQFVNGKGELTEETPFAGMWVKDADPEVLKDLSARKQLFDAPKFEHEYPTTTIWECDHEGR